MENRVPHIFDTIENCDKYAALNPRFAKAFEFLKRKNLSSLPCGKYDIIPDECWATVQDAQLHTFDSARLEAHRKYIDIQAPLTGPELFGYKVMDRRELTFPFDAEKDCVLFEGEMEKRTLEPGEFAIFFPPDGAHAPCCTEEGFHLHRKLVIKVLAD